MARPSTSHVPRPSPSLRVLVVIVLTPSLSVTLAPPIALPSVPDTRPLSVPSPGTSSTSIGAAGSIRAASTTYFCVSNPSLEKVSR